MKFIMKTLRLLSLLVLLTTLSACQHYRWQNYISDQNKQYIAAQSTAPLTIPANLNDASLSDHQVIIPALPATNTGVIAPSLLPPASMAAQLQAGTLPASVLKTKLPDPD